MIVNDTDSNLMLPSITLRIIWNILTLFSSFLCPFVFPCFSSDAQCCYFCLLKPFHNSLHQSIHWFQADLKPNMFMTFLSAFKHNTASHTPNLSVSIPTKTILGILVQITDFTCGSFHGKPIYLRNKVEPDHSR
jgi:hypothetical protein